MSTSSTASFFSFSTTYYISIRPSFIPTATFFDDQIQDENHNWFLLFGNNTNQSNKPIRYNAAIINNDIVNYRPPIIGMPNKKTAQDNSRIKKKPQKKRSDLAELSLIQTHQELSAFNILRRGY